MTERTASCSTSHELQPTDVSLISPTKSSNKIMKGKGSSLVSDLDLAVTEGVKDIMNHNGHSSSDISGCGVLQEGSQNFCFDVCSSKSKCLSNSNEDTGKLLIESEFAKIQKLRLVCNGEIEVAGVDDCNSDETNIVPLNPSTSTQHVVENSANMFPPRHKLLQYQSQYANTSDNSNTKTNLVSQDDDNEELCVHCSSHYSQSMRKSKNFEKINGLAENLTTLSLGVNVSVDSQLTIKSADCKMQKCEIECTSSVCDPEAQLKVSSCECHNEETDNHVPSAETDTSKSSACQHELKGELDTLVVRLEDTNFNYSDSTSEPSAIVTKELNSRHFGSGDTTEKPDDEDSVVTYEVYESEKQMPDIIRLITKDLSEPYSIYTYRYFIHNWPKLCFLALADNKCVGAIVCKLDLHKKMVRRGYIAMLAVDSEYRRRKIGSTLVTKAIEAMIQDDCDEVVLETEITNQGALRLYENLGFVRDKRLFRYYLNGVDALRLKLWLR